MGESSNGGKGSRSKSRFSVLGGLDGAQPAPEPKTRSSSGGRSRRRHRPQASRPAGPPAKPQLHDPDAKSARRRRRRGRRGRGRPHDNGGQQGQRQQGQRPETQASGKSEIGAFTLFAAYHLGIDETGHYRPTNIHDVARRFNTSAGGIRQSLTSLGMDSDAVINSDFDMAMAQYDIQVAPEGIDIMELAKNLYREFRESSPNARDWERELAEDAAANAKTFNSDDE